jgi:hypothetical protein
LCINDLYSNDNKYSAVLATNLEAKGVDSKIEKKKQRFNTTKILFKVKIIFVGLKKSDEKYLANLASDRITELNKGFSGSKIQFKLISKYDFIPDTYEGLELFDRLRKYEEKYDNRFVNLFVYNNLIDKYSGFSPNPFTKEKGHDHRFKMAYAHIHVDAYANESSTLIHEFGHLFGLFHTHKVWDGKKENVRRSNCYTAGDFLCDTPADPNLDNEVDATLENSDECEYIGDKKDDKGMPYQPDVQNFMSYSYYGCRSRFTNGQISVINRSALLWSTSLIAKKSKSEIVESTGRIFYDLASPIDRNVGVPTKFVLIVAVNDSVLYSKRLEEYLLFTERIRVEDLLVQNKISIVLYNDNDPYLLGRLFNNVTLSNSDGFSNRDKKLINIILNGQILKCPTIILLEVVPDEFRYKLKLFVDSYLHVDNLIKLLKNHTDE